MTTPVHPGRIDIPVLETERLILRAPHWADFEPYAAFCASERSVGVGGPYSRGQSFSRLAGLIGHWQIRGYGRWMVTDRNDGAALGVVGLFYPEGWPEPELAWSLFANGEGRGVAREAALEARRFAYEELGWTTLISLIMPDNIRSKALADRMGCSYEGTFPHEDYGDMHIWRHPGPDA